MHTKLNNETDDAYRERMTEIGFDLFAAGNCGWFGHVRLPLTNDPNHTPNRTKIRKFTDSFCRFFGMFSSGDAQFRRKQLD